jgi:hypothetical protein
MAEPAREFFCGFSGHAGCKTICGTTETGMNIAVKSALMTRDMQAQAEITLELIPGIENIDNAEKMLAALAFIRRTK